MTIYDYVEHLKNANLTDIDRVSLRARKKAAFQVLGRRGRRRGRRREGKKERRREGEKERRREGEKERRREGEKERRREGVINSF